MYSISTHVMRLVLGRVLHFIFYNEMLSISLQYSRGTSMCNVQYSNPAAFAAGLKNLRIKTLHFLSDSPNGITRIFRLK